MTHNRDPGTGLSKKELLGGTVPLTMEWSKMAEIMKTFYKSMMLVAAAAMAFVSCQKEIENPEIDNAPKMKTIKVSTDIATRTTLDSNHENIVWSTGDEISIFNNANNNNSELTYAADGYIEVEVPEATTEIYAHYPYYSGNTSGPESVSIYIAKNQTQTNPGELNGYYYPMVAKGTVSADNKALISLYPVAGALALNLYHTGLSGSESVSSVKVTVSNTGIVGSQSTDITADNVQYTAPATDGPVTVTLTNPLALGNSKPTDTQAFDGQIYVCLAKQSYSEVTFEITTDKGTYTITSNSTAFDLENNDFVPVNINLAKAAKEVAPTVFTVGTEIATIFPSVKNGIKFEYAQGEGTIAPAYYSPFRWQNNSTVTISAGTTPIEKVVFSSAATTVTADSGTYSEGTWTASDDETTSVTFTNTGNQITFKSIEVYTDESGTETVVTSTPSLTIDETAEIPVGTTSNLAASTNYNNATITYASDDTDVATVDSDGVVTAVAQGTATITASIAGVTTDFYVIESASAECEVTVTSADNVTSYQLVTDVSDLTVGSKVVIVSSSSSYALGSTQNANNRSAAEITKDGNTVKVASEDVQELTIGNGYKAGTYSLSTGEGYLYAASSSNNYLKTEEDLDANGSWSISISSTTGEATIIAIGANTRNFIRYNPNNGSPLFTCYATGSTTGESVKIYKKNDTGSGAITAKVPESLTIAGATTTYSVGDEYSFDGTVTLVYSDTSTETLSASDYTVNSSNVDMTTAGTYTVPVTYNADNSVFGTYSVTVSDGGTASTPVTATLTLSSSNKFGTTSGSTLTDDQGNTWTLSTTSTTTYIQNSYSSQYAGQQLGTAKSNVSYTISSTLSGATITSVSVTAAAGSSTPTYDISVGTSSWKSGSLSTTSTTYTGTGSASGQVVITLDQNSGSKAMYLGAISITYTN